MRNIREHSYVSYGLRLIKERKNTDMRGGIYLQLKASDKHDGIAVNCYFNLTNSRFLCRVKFLVQSISRLFKKVC